MNFDELKQKIKQAGVIGAGGAGFPTHMKLTKGIDTIVVNAAECEPLLYTDFNIMKQYMDMVINGAKAVRSALNAKQVVIGMKEHTSEKLGFKDNTKLDDCCSVKTMPNSYPMGDEVILIYQTLKRIVPPGQLPSSVGVIVINVETALNIANSLNDIPVTHKYITVGGDIEKPMSYRVPINCDVKNILKAVKLEVPKGHVVIDGGPAMGNIINPNIAVVTKKTKAILILPDDIPAVTLKNVSVDRMLKRTSSACCQCFHCTEICPRHLIGYPLEPHKTLRAVVNKITDKPNNLITASLCSGCGVCTLMACCQGIAPSIAMTQVKKNLGKYHLGYRSDKSTQVNVERDNRLVPIETFKRRIGVNSFDKQAVFGGDLKVNQKVYRLKLSQHVGKPSIPIVKAGDKVSAGTMIAKADSGISAALHTPVSGTVTSVSNSQIEITV